MKINFNTYYDANDPCFGDLAIGNCFLYEGYETVFMKINEIRDDLNYRLNAIDLSTTAIMFIADEEKVKSISVVLNKEN